MRNFNYWLDQLNGTFILVVDNFTTLAEDFPNQCLVIEFSSDVYCYYCLVLFSSVKNLFPLAVRNRHTIIRDEMAEYSGILEVKIR